MLFEVSPKDSTASTAWPSSGAGAAPSSKRVSCRSPRAIWKSMGASLWQPGAVADIQAACANADRARRQPAHEPRTPVAILGVPATQGPQAPCAGGQETQFGALPQ